MLNWPRETKGGWSRICEKLETGAINRIKGLPCRWLVSPGKAVSENRLEPSEPSVLLFISRERSHPAGLTLTACNAGKQLEAASFKPGHRFFRVATPLKAGKFKASLQAT